MTARSLFITAILFLSCASTTQAWSCIPVEDAELVERSELIVVGAIKDGSIVFVPHKVPPGAGISYEHHAVLKFHEVLKGECREKEIPIIIHYGLDPIIGGQSDHEGLKVVNLAPAEDNPKGAIKIFDVGGESDRISSITDARQDNLWFLRRRGGEYGREPSSDGNFGIVDPEDFQSLLLKSYMLAFLGPDPENAVRKQIVEQPKLAERAMRYLDQREIERIVQIADPAVRVERLIPYLMNRSTQDEATRAIVAAGPVAGPYLLGVYNRAWEPNVRDKVIYLWGQIRWAGCADILTEFLKTSDQYWAAQKLDPGWWNNDGDSAATNRRREEYGKLYHAVWTLRQLRVPNAAAAIELTRKRWAAINFENKQIVEECDAALKELAVPAKE